MSTVAKFATVQTEGNRKELEKRFSDHEFRLADVENAMKYVLDTLMPPIQNRRRIGFNAE